ncbi:MAG: histidinol-phosphate transaminase [Deltaproteobacteria bacterium]|nr:histidinol-phosphate transaminase [Deltaproteobacteria bacterium]
MMNVDLDSLVPAHIRKFESYIPSKPDDELQKLYGCGPIIRLNNNENPLGPPPGAQEVLRRFPPPRASVYPSGDSFHLRRKLAGLHGLDPDQILVGNGANEVIAFVIKAFCKEGDNIITAEKTFAVYEWVAEFSGFQAKLVAMKDHGFDDEGMLARIDDRTKILFLCNPNNPTGTYWSEGKLRRFLDRIAGHRIVVVDEAYFEFVEQENYPNGIELLREYPNLVVFRTFSKMYALAGLRIGYLAGNLDVVDVIRKTCVVYSVNSLAQEAALAALDDERHILRTRDMVKRGKALLTDELTRLQLPFVLGEGNYIMIRLPMSDTLAYRRLMKFGVMVRSMTGFRFPNFIRVTISERPAMEAFVRALEKILE